MPVPLDEYPVHQVPMSMRYMESSDRNSYDRSYWNAQDRTGEVFLVTGLGVYPNLGVIDVHAVRKTGGSTMAVIIATPLSAEPRSIFRLFRKLTGHLDYKDTDEYREQCGTGNTDIEVNIHKESDAAVFELLAALPDFVEQGGARLVVKDLE